MSSCTVVLKLKPYFQNETNDTNTLSEDDEDSVYW